MGVRRTSASNSREEYKRLCREQHNRVESESKERNGVKDQDLWKGSIHENRSTCGSMEKRTLELYMNMHF